MFKYKTHLNLLHMLLMEVSCQNKAARTAMMLSVFSPPISTTVTVLYVYSNMSAYIRNILLI